jgi:hypothetical protein
MVITFLGGKKLRIMLHFNIKCQHRRGEERTGEKRRDGGWSQKTMWMNSARENIYYVKENTNKGAKPQQFESISKPRENIEPALLPRPACPAARRDYALLHYVEHTRR